MDEREAMTRALDLAWRGWGRVAPNPLVGAVVLRDGVVKGEGWHGEYGGPHAERAALAAADDSVKGGTLVTTLEPCSHHGKTPPCVDAIVAAGIRRVVAALPDPNPIAAGGAARLRAAGIEVEFGMLAEQAAAQNAAFLHRVADASRPWVALKLATTIDFRIADQAGRSRWISGPEAREFVHWLRAGFDALAVGVGTARADDPALTARGEPAPRVPLRRVVFDRAAELPTTLRLVAERPEATTVVAGPDAPDERLRALQARGVQILCAEDETAALRLLRESGTGSLLVEGGGRLAGAMLAAGLVDRFYWITAPLWLGDAGVPAVRGLPSRPLDQTERWRVVERRALGGDTLIVLDRR
jgi:diaminohydroxyphosphoribosylaminopyrimidine deaminase/5-amino-6-(5-phosphoribosylamino)uracil reductase